MTTNEPPRQFWPSMGALGAGLLAIVALSLGTDVVLRLAGVFPPAGEPMVGEGLYLLALGYRSFYAVVGSWLTARLAPRRPLRHAVELGIVGFVLSAAGAAAAWNSPELGPRWYALALVLTAIPCGWLGGLVHRRLTAGGG